MRPSPGGVLIQDRDCGSQGLGHGDVAESDHRDVGASGLVQGEHERHRAGDVRGEHGGGRVWCRQPLDQFRGGLIGGLEGHADEVGTVGEPVLRHRGAVAPEPAVGGRHRGRDTEEGNAPVPVAGEVRDRLAGAAQVVLDHVHAGEPPRGPVDEHHRRPLLPGGQVGLVRAHAHHDQAADLAPQQRLQGGALAVGAVVKAGHHDRHAPAHQVKFDAARHRGEERVSEVGNGQADRGVRAGAETPGQQVRHVVQLLHGPAHPLTGLLGDVGIVVEDPGYGLRADSGDTSNVAHGSHRGSSPPDWAPAQATAGVWFGRYERRSSGGEGPPVNTGGPFAGHYIGS